PSEGDAREDPASEGGPPRSRRGACLDEGRAGWAPVALRASRTDRAYAGDSPSSEVGLQQVWRRRLTTFEAALSLLRITAGDLRRGMMAKQLGANQDWINGSGGRISSNGGAAAEGESEGIGD